MIDERDLQWRIPALSIIFYVMAAACVLFLLIAIPICAVPLALVVGLRAYYIHFIVNKKKKLALANYYGSMDTQSKQQCFLQRYTDPGSVIFNMLFSAVDRLEDYRLILLKPEVIKLCEFGGANYSGTQKTYRVNSIESITLNDMKIMRGVAFSFKNAEAKTEHLYVSSHTTKNFDQLEQLVKSYYGKYIKN